MSCACGEGELGVRICSDGVYGDCVECEEVTTADACVPGYYVGEASGSYRSAALLPGVLAPFSDEVTTRWAFSLEKMGTVEFFTLGDACVHINSPDADSDEGHARFWLTGQIDCTTGLLEGEMRGYHSPENLDGTRTRYYYKGKIAGRYDPETQSFIETAYKVVEPPVLLGDQPGGEGSWTAELREGETPPEDVETTQADCLGEDFPADDMFEEVTL